MSSDGPGALLHVLVVGAGAAGKRHLANLRQLRARVSLVRARVGYAEDLQALAGGIEVYDTLEAALAAAPDAAVVANRTDLHVGTANDLAAAGVHLYIEKPLGASLEGVEDLRSAVDRNGLLVEIGCMWRFHPAIRRLEQALATGQIGRPVLARLALGHHLGGWRPGDHRHSYSARTAEGGGVILDLIHEIDLACWLLGPIDSVQATAATVPELEVATEAIAVLVLRHASGALANISIDAVRPSPQHALEIVGSRGELSWDIRAGKLTAMTPGGEVTLLDASGEVRNAMFQAHMEHFLRRVGAAKRGDVPDAAGVSLRDGIGALRVALAARRAAAGGTTVRPEEIT